MVYSCGYFTDWDNDIATAQRDKLEMICRKPRLKPEEKLLDVDCGWGGLICYAAQHYGVRAHGLTLSQQQYDYVRDKIVRLGLGDRVTIELKDYAGVQGQFDKIAQIEMIEHRRTDPGRWADIAAWLLRRVGPRLRGHRTARSQLKAAFPDKSDGEIEQILGGMWDNLARSIVEYATLDLMWDHDLVHPSRGRIEVDQASIDRWAGLLADKRPSLGFAAHLANWELAALAMSVHGRQAAIPMRTPKIRALADELIRIA